jgi:large subunit ribosomal protein L30
MAGGKKLKLTLLKSTFGRGAVNRACVNGLGLRRIRQSAVVADTPENRGMIERVAFMLKIEEV